MTFRNAKGRTLGRMHFGREERYGYSMCMVPRAVVHEALLKEVDAKDIRWGVRVVGLRDVDEVKVASSYNMRMELKKRRTWSLALMVFEVL
jgi:2-polyprenyl-6-methoxyphenol hydroxylase-like FAD-dependent oxidoreductase